MLPENVVTCVFIFSGEIKCVYVCIYEVIKKKLRN